MVHVFRLGPLEVGGRKAYAYCGLDAGGAPIPAEITHTDARGLGALAKRYAGQPIRCEPALAEAARPFGFEPAPLPKAALLPRATLAYGLALGPMAGRPKLDILIRFLEACAAFWSARPWELLGSDDPVPVALTEKGRTRKAEASVMGAAGQEFGVALYDEPGSIRRVAALVTAGRMKCSDFRGCRCRSGCGRARAARRRRRSCSTPRPSSKRWPSFPAQTTRSMPRSPSRRAARRSPLALPYRTTMASRAPRISPSRCSCRSRSPRRGGRRPHATRHARAARGASTRSAISRRKRRARQPRAAR